MATISNNMQNLINEQYHKELFSAHQYFAICSYFLENDLDGFANFFKIQAEEELMHADKQFQYIHQVEGRMKIKGIEAPINEFGSIESAINTAYEHEKFISKSINEIMKAAMQEGDFATYNFFQWFVEEQIEEEDLFRNLLSKIRLVGENKSGLYLLNEELKGRAGESE